ncbi:MAG TPA: hypothetical protein VE685_26830 [Thermoanaerobaculia bacterium]|nr:hypothetical protein [Thermoanaerobaculia bacterium]
MPNGSFGDEIREMEGTLAAFAENAEQLGAAEPHRAALEVIVGEAKALKDRQDSYIAARQEVTQQLREAMVRGREAARCLRSAVRAILGTQNERLVQFKVAPLRKRPRKLRTPEETPPTEPPQAA